MALKAKIKSIMNPSSIKEFMGRGAAFTGVNLLAKGYTSIITPRNPPIPPGAMMSTGKRGIDSNNLNSSGIGLAMYRNRRR